MSFSATAQTQVETIDAASITGSVTFDGQQNVILTGELTLEPNTSDGVFILGNATVEAVNTVNTVDVLDLRALPIYSVGDDARLNITSPLLDVGAAPLLDVGDNARVSLNGVDAVVDSRSPWIRVFGDSVIELIGSRVSGRADAAAVVVDGSARLTLIDSDLGRLGTSGVDLNGRSVATFNQSSAGYVDVGDDATLEAVDSVIRGAVGSDSNTISGRATATFVGGEVTGSDSLSILDAAVVRLDGGVRVGVVAGSSDAIVVRDDATLFVDDARITLPEAVSGEPPAGNTFALLISDRSRAVLGAGAVIETRLAEVSDDGSNPARLPTIVVQGQAELEIFGAEFIAGSSEAQAVPDIFAVGQSRLILNGDLTTFALDEALLGLENAVGDQTVPLPQSGTLSGVLASGQFIEFDFLQSANASIVFRSSVVDPGAGTTPGPTPVPTPTAAAAGLVLLGGLLRRRRG